VDHILGLLEVGLSECSRSSLMSVCQAHYLYLDRADDVFALVWWFVCWFVCEQDYLDSYG